MVALFNASMEWGLRTMPSDDEIESGQTGKAAVDILREVARLAHMTECVVAAQLPSPITVAQYSVLKVLSVSSECLSITQLADMQSVSQPTMSSTVAKLKDRGLIETVSRPNDRRTRYVTLTEEGRNMKRTCDEKALPVLSRVVERVPHADWASLQRIVAGINGALAVTLKENEAK